MARRRRSFMDDFMAGYNAGGQVFSDWEISKLDEENWGKDESTDADMNDNQGLVSTGRSNKMGGPWAGEAPKGIGTTYKPPEMEVQDESWMGDNYGMQRAEKEAAIYRKYGMKQDARNATNDARNARVADMQYKGLQRQDELENMRMESVKSFKSANSSEEAFANYLQQRAGLYNNAKEGEFADGANIGVSNGMITYVSADGKVSNIPVAEAYNNLKLRSDLLAKAYMLETMQYDPQGAQNYLNYGLRERELAMNEKYKRDYIGVMQNRYGKEGSTDFSYGSPEAFIKEHLADFGGDINAALRAWQTLQRNKALNSEGLEQLLAQERASATETPVPPPVDRNAGFMGQDNRLPGSTGDEWYNMRLDEVPEAAGGYLGKKIHEWTQPDPDEEKKKPQRRQRSTR